MEIKFQYPLNKYKYLLMFDLASKVSGICLWDLQANKPIETAVIKVANNAELSIADLDEKINEYFQQLQDKGYSLQDILVSKEMAPLQAGKFTTAQTLIALGKAHAVLDLYCYKNSIDVFDYVGVSPSTTHAYFRGLLNIDKKQPITKEDIRDYIYSEYDIRDIILDESDAVFLAKTFIDIYWNRQIDERIKEVKRHRKTLKADHAIKACDAEIERLRLLKL